MNGTVRSIAGVVALACGLGTGATVLAPITTAAATTGAGITAPKRSWDPAILPLVHEVERFRGLQFDHAVPVKYPGDKAFEKRLLGDDDTTAEEDRAYDRGASVLRALGLLAGDVDLHDAGRDVVGSDTIAFYDQETEDIVVRGHDTTSPSTRVTIVHELTHALQDQHFDLTKLQDHAADDAYSVLDAADRG